MAIPSNDLVSVSKSTFKKKPRFVASDLKYGVRYLYAARTEGLHNSIQTLSNSKVNIYFT